MKIILIALKFIRQNLSRPTTLLLLSLAPVLLMLILSKAFSGLFYTEPGESALRLASYIQTEGILAAGFREMSSNIKEPMGIEITGVQNLEAGKQSVADGIYDGLVVINNKSMELFVNGSSGIKAGILEEILSSYLGQVSFITTVLESTTMEEAVRLSSTGQAEGNIIKQTLNASRQPRSVDYFGITILTMTIMFSAHLASYGIMKERRLKTMDRIILSPAGRGEFLAGYTLGTLVSLVLQMTAVFLAAYLVIGVYYGENLLPVILLLLSECFFALALGAGLAELIKDEKGAIGLMNAIIPTLIFLGGGYAKLPDTAVFKVLSKISPMDWINKALFETIYSGGNKYFLPAILINTGTGILIMALSVLKGNIMAQKGYEELKREAA